MFYQHMGVENNVTGSFCGKERDRTKHIFLRCQHVKRFLGTITDSSI